MPEIQKVPPKYEQIASPIRDQIIAGELKPGDKVPSGRFLMKLWKVSRPTADAALDLLKHQGYIEARQGSGSYVREALPGDPSAMLTVDVSFRTEFLAVELAPGPAQATHALGEPEEAELLRRQLLIHNSEDEPARIQTSWFAPRLADEAPLLLERAQPPEGVEAYLAATAGHHPTRTLRENSARLATPAERRQLDLASPSAVLEHRVTVFGADGAVLRFDEIVCPPDTWYPESDHPSLSG
ncbi:GntR family transcriptional regulator [Amycolatopsis sp. NPDC059657]|uniref:GntR family transcriptional regulator n=1 Tax=Amycolatopsis sp. NPDC059657 TaxID=3346899 RepID=UPI0036734BE4